ncbi:MAG: PBSX family phage terminase large subunit [Coriobacteriales bacterium]|nr:PBSX family phage terminase large subunit [Coriobacteriales bacterium]
MTKELTQGQMLYVAARMEGKTQREAYRVAYPKSRKWKDSAVDAAACRLEKTSKVSARLEKSRTENLTKAALNRVDIINRMADANSLAYAAVKEQQQLTEGKVINKDALDAFIKTADRLLALPEVKQDTDGNLLPLIDTAAAISANFIDVHRAIVNRNYPEFIFTGGRGSLKSSLASISVILALLRDRHAFAVCTRRVANTLRRSVLASCKWAISVLGLTALFSDTVSPMEITFNPTGQKILFYGVDEPEKLKSITLPDPKDKIKILWWEEYDQQDSPEAVRSVEQTLMRAEYFLSLKTFNPPPDENQWANLEVKRIDECASERVLHHHSTYLEAPREWLGPVFYEKAEELKEINPKAYENEYLGIAVGPAGRVFENVRERSITDEEIAGFKWIRNGIDWGFQRDPWVFGRVAYDRKKKILYIFDEEYNVGVRNEDTAAIVKEHLKTPVPNTEGEYEFLKNLPENRVLCDIAEQKSIADYNAFGIKAIGASKWPGSVTQGVKWLQQRRAIVIDRKRAPLHYQEFIGYRAEEDEKGRFKGYPDKDNHAIDEVRYAVAELIGNTKET